MYVVLSFLLSLRGSAIFLKIPIYFNLVTKFIEEIKDFKNRIYVYLYEFLEISMNILI